MTIIDPPPAPEGGSNARPADLLNQPILVRATGTGVWDEESKSPGKPFVICDVWTLDRAGIVEHHEGMWISWWKAVEQLKDSIGQIVACRPTKQDDNSIELAALEGKAREVAAEAAAGLVATESLASDLGATNEDIAPPAYADGEEPF